jgi:hypothetical protein
MKTMARIKRTTPRKELLEIMRESHLFANQKEARYALGAVCCAVRNWLIAMTGNPPKHVMSRLNIPGVGAFRVAWYEYGDRYSPKVVIRFGATSTVRNQVRANNKREYECWKQRLELSGLPIPQNAKKPK